MAKQTKREPPQCLVEATNAALLAELRRRYIAFLFAGVSVNDNNEAVCEQEQKGCVSVLKHLHSEQECRLEVRQREELKRFGERVVRTLDGKALADGDVFSDPTGTGT